MNKSMSDSEALIHYRLLISNSTDIVSFKSNLYDAESIGDLIVSSLLVPMFDD